MGLAGEKFQDSLQGFRQMPQRGKVAEITVKGWVIRQMPVDQEICHLLERRGSSQFRN
jgi:hypothetical protein